MIELMQRMTKKEKRLATLEAHYKLCAELGALCGSKLTGKKISTKLMKLEKLAHSGAEAYCNGDAGLLAGKHFNFCRDENAWEKFSEMIEQRLAKILPNIPLGFFVNGDPRGYALKLEPGSVPIKLHEDWGRYQILSPDLFSEGGI